MMAAALLAVSAPYAYGSTVITCDLWGTVESSPEEVRSYLRDGGEATHVKFKFKVTRGAPTAGARTDTDCTRFKDSEIGVDVSGAPTGIVRRNATLRLQYLYRDDMGGSSTRYELLQPR